MQKPKPVTKKKTEPITNYCWKQVNIKYQDMSKHTSTTTHATEQPKYTVKEGKTCTEKKRPFHALRKTQHALLAQYCQQGIQPAIMSVI